MAEMASKAMVDFYPHIYSNMIFIMSSEQNFF